jgi:hypothetical protein
MRSLEHLDERYCATAFVLGSGMGVTQGARHMRGLITAQTLSLINRRHITVDKLDTASVRGIRPEGYKLAIRLVGAKQRRVMSPAQRAVLEKARLASPLISLPSGWHSPGLEFSTRIITIFAPVSLLPGAAFRDALLLK